MILNWMLDKIKKIKVYYDVLVHKRCLVLVNTPLHGNLGDHAIAYAEEQFIKDYFPEYTLVEISSSLSVARTIRFDVLSRLNPKAIFLIHAGGYLGDLWPDEERRVKNILSSIRTNPKIILPQTYYIMNPDNKKEKYHEDKAFYSKLSNLIVCLRDKSSYEIFTNEILDKSQCILLPDIVTYLSALSEEFTTNSISVRKGVLMCIRSDHEKMLDPYIEKGIIDYLNKNSIEYSYTDTCVNHMIAQNDRKMELLQKWKEFSQAKLVITDRIHGMIFSALTGTPCIAFDNVSKKVSGAYSWISYLKYLKIIESCNLEEIKTSINEYMSISDNKYSNESLNQYYEALANCIREKGA